MRRLPATAPGATLVVLIAPPPAEKDVWKACARIRETLVSSTASRALRFPGRRNGEWKTPRDSGRERTRSPRGGTGPPCRTAREGRGREPRDEGRPGAWRRD